MRVLRFLAQCSENQVRSVHPVDITEATDRVACNKMVCVWMVAAWKTAHDE